MHLLGITAENGSLIATIGLLPKLHLTRDSFTDFQLHIIEVLNDPAVVDEPADPVRILAVRIVKMIPNEIGAVCLALNSERIRVDVSNGYGVGIQSPQRNVFLFQRIVNGLFAFVSAHYDYLHSVA